MAEINPFVSVEYLEVARERVTQQFIGKPVFDKYLQILLAGEADIQNTLRQLMQLRSIETAVGVNLDNIGEIVGQPRELLEADLYEYFGFQGANKAQSMGTLEDTTLGGIFYSLGTPLGGNILLDDETYRKFIKAKIFKNVTSSTPEEFITVVNTIFNLPLSITFEGDGQAILMFGRLLTPFEKVLLQYVSYSQGFPSRLIPKTVGVRINYGEFQSDGYFGFQGAPGAKGFGDLFGTYGYGLGYGIKYGDSDFGQQPVWDNTCDGDILVGQEGANFTATIIGQEPATKGGVFATLF